MRTLSLKNKTEIGRLCISKSLSHMLDRPWFCCWSVSVRSCRCSRRRPPAPNSSRNQKDQGSLMTVERRDLLLPPQPASSTLHSTHITACDARPQRWDLHTHTQKEKTLQHSALATKAIVTASLLQDKPASKLVVLGFGIKIV